MKVTKRQVNKVLRDAALSTVDPTMSIIMDVGNGDWLYYVKRAQEYLAHLEHCATKEQRAIYVNLIIKLMTLAIIYNDHE